MFIVQPLVSVYNEQTTVYGLCPSEEKYIS